MKITKNALSWLLGISIITPINLSAAVDFDRLFTDLSNLLTMIADKNEGIIPSVDKLKYDFTVMKIFTGCSKLSAQDKLTKPGKIGTVSAKCADVKLLIKSLISVLSFFEHKLIGDENKPGAMYTILSLFDAAGIKVQEVKSTVSDISKLIAMINKLLSELEDKVHVETGSAAAAKATK